MKAPQLHTVLLPLVTLALVASTWVAVRAEAVEERARASTTVSAQASRAVAQAGGKVVLKGKVSGPKRRPVVLETKVSGSWRTLARGRTNAQRRYQLRLPTDWYHRHTLRVRAPAAGSAAAGTSRTRTVLVKPSYRPIGQRTSYSSSQNYRWNPCKPITWRFHPGGGFKGSLKVVKRSVVEVSRATGLTFTYRGTTSKVPVRDDISGVADLVIGWATPQQVGVLAGSTAGFAESRGSGPSAGRLEIFQGEVALDRTESLATSYAAQGRVAWGQVMVHEIAHAVGLNHVSASNQLMAPVATTSNSRLGQGDLRGLQLVGLAQGCWNLGAR